MRPKVDGNQRAIVEALRQTGCSVQSLAAVGDGCPDLLVGTHGQNFLLELKLAKTRLNIQQVYWHERWRGQVRVARSVDEALAAVRVEVSEK